MADEDDDNTDTDTEEEALDRENGGDADAEEPGELCGRLGVAQIGRHDDGVGEVIRRCMLVP